MKNPCIQMEELTEFGSFFIRCKNHDYWTIATYDEENKYWKGKLEGMSEGLPWIAPSVQSITSNFCACVHNYFEACHELRKPPEVPERCEGFMPDAPFVCEIEGSGTRISIDDENAEVIVSIRNSINDEVLEEYRVKEIITQVDDEEGIDVTTIRVVPQ